MRNAFFSFIFSAAFLLLAGQSIQAQEVLPGVTFDEVTYDFGDILLTDGPVSCSFTLSNRSKSDVEILNVNSTCGCTTVEWTKGKIAAGGSGKVKVTYSNDEGPMAFSKTVLAYIDGVKKPVSLTVKGQTYEKALTLEEAYPVKIGKFGVKQLCNKVGTLYQGEYKSASIKIANFSSESRTPLIESLSPNLTFRLEPSTIPARGTAELTVTVKSSANLWGKNFYNLTLSDTGKTIAGRYLTNELSFWATTMENFANWTAEQKKKAPSIRVKQTNFSVGRIKVGKVVEAVFPITNEGKSNLIIYSVLCESPGTEVMVSPAPSVKPSYEAYVKVKIDTQVLAAGPATLEGSSAPGNDLPVIITLYTNSPSRPVVNLFVVGELKK